MLFSREETYIEMCQVVQKLEHEARDEGKMYVHFQHRDNGDEKPRYLSTTKGEVHQHQWLHIHQNTLTILKPVIGR